MINSDEEAAKGGPLKTTTKTARGEAGETGGKMMKVTEVNVTVRKALREDMVQVYKLVKALAEFEKLEDQVKIDLKTLEEDGFSDSPAFHCLVSEVSDGYIMGYALYYTCYSTWLGKSIFLEDLYIHPAYRGNGIGKQMMLAIAKIAHETSGRLDFHVLNWNPATEFYKRLGAVNLTHAEKWQLFRLDNENLAKLFSENDQAECNGN